MTDSWHISLDTERGEAVPYFCWDTPTTNAQLRAVLRDGPEDAKVAWIARIMTEAQYGDVWKYLSLRDDVLPRWERVRPRLGRRREFWEFLLNAWRRDGLMRLACVVRGDETTLVDLVLDRAPQVVTSKALVGLVRLDPLREIAANKICALLDRFEARDLVDLERLLIEGIQLADAVGCSAQARWGGPGQPRMDSVAGAGRSDGAPPAGNVGRQARCIPRDANPQPDRHGSAPNLAIATPGKQWKRQP